MIKLCSLLIIIGISHYESWAQRKSEKLMFQYLSPLQISNNISNSESRYFLSQNAASFSTSNGDCKTVFGRHSSLVTIETLEELRNLSSLLISSDNSGSSYWIGGQYSTRLGNFSWINGATVGPWAPWDKGHPESQTSATRLYASYIIGQSINFRTAYQTALKRYICEVRTSKVEEALPCYSDNDLVISIDSSGSISPDQYKIALEFAARLASTWMDNQGNRLSVFVYSNQVKPILSMNDIKSVQLTRNAIYKSVHLNQGTASHLALRFAISQFNLNARNVAKNLVFLTDGESNDANLTAQAASQVRKAGIRTFSVGIGSGVGTKELLTIAGDSKRVFKTEGFNDLLVLLSPISRQLCK